MSMKKLTVLGSQAIETAKKGIMASDISGRQDVVVSMNGGNAQTKTFSEGFDGGAYSDGQVIFDTNSTGGIFPIGGVNFSIGKNTSAQNAGTKVTKIGSVGNPGGGLCLENVLNSGGSNAFFTGVNASDLGLSFIRQFSMSMRVNLTGDAALVGADGASINQAIDGNILFLLQDGEWSLANPYTGEFFPTGCPLNADEAHKLVITYSVDTAGIMTVSGGSASYSVDLNIVLGPPGWGGIGLNFFENGPTHDSTWSLDDITYTFVAYEANPLTHIEYQVKTIPLTGDPDGHVKVELYNNMNHKVKELNVNLDHYSLMLRLICDDAINASSDQSPRKPDYLEDAVIIYNVAPDKFSTGKLVLTCNGKLSSLELQGEVIDAVNGQQSPLDVNVAGQGKYQITIPFKVENI